MTLNLKHFGNLCSGLSQHSICTMKWHLIHPIASPGHAKDVEVDNKMQSNSEVWLKIWSFPWICVLTDQHRICTLTWHIYIPWQALVMLNNLTQRVRYSLKTKSLTLNLSWPVLYNITHKANRHLDMILVKNYGISLEATLTNPIKYVPYHVIYTLLTMPSSCLSI